MQNPTITPVLDIRYPLKNGTFRVKIRITFQAKSKYRLTAHAMTPQEFERVMKARSGKPRKIWEAIEDERVAVVNNFANQPFSWELYTRIYGKKKAPQESTPKENTPKAKTLTEHFKSYIDSQQEEGTRSSYREAFNSLESFFGDRFTFDHVGAKQLKAYENWMLSKGCSPSTIGIYTRPLRAVFNDAGKVGDSYPFGKRKYQIPKSKNIKKALSRAQLIQIRDYPCRDEKEKMYRDFWLFLYYCNGINVHDMCLLKWVDIRGDIMTIIRKKTKRSAPKVITIILQKPVLETIRKYGTKSKYVFDVLNDNMNVKQVKREVKNFRRRICAHMKNIAIALNLEFFPTAYHARHSFATALKRDGVPISYISDALGHSNIATTQHYLDHFGEEAARKFSKSIRLDEGEDAL